MPSSAHFLAAQRSPTNVLPDPYSVGGNGAGMRRVRCCNRAATGAGHTQTEQENNDARNAKNRLDKWNLLTKQYLPGKL